MDTRSPTEFVRACTDIYEDGATLRLKLKEEFEIEDWNHHWSRVIPQKYPGPWSKVIIDMEHLPLPCSSFYGGSLQLLEGLRQSQLTCIHLINYHPRVEQTITMMNLQHFLRLE